MPFDLVLLASNLGLLAVTFATKSFFVNLERRSKAFSLVNGDRGREIFRLVFNVDVSIGASMLARSVKEGRGDARQLSSSLCENVRFFSGIILKIEVSEYERVLIPTPGQGTANKAGSLTHSSIADPNAAGQDFT